jgi:hypothetical protein
MASDNIFWQCIEYVRGLSDKALANEPVVVSIGGSTVQKPAEFLVREVVESVSFTDSVTSSMGTRAAGHYRVEFSVACQAWAQRASLMDASELVQSWMLAMFRQVAADKTLGGLVVHAEPYVSNGGTALDKGTKLYTAAFDFGVRIKAEIEPATV